MNAAPEPWIFRVGVLATAGAFALLAAQMRAATRDRGGRGRLTAGQSEAVTGAVVVIATALTVLALVPYDAGPTQHLIHNLAGWGSGWVIAASMLAVPRSLRVFDRRFYGQTWIALAVFMSCFLGFELGVLTYAVAEIAAIITAAAWTTALFARLEPSSDEAD